MYFLMEVYMCMKRSSEIKKKERNGRVGNNYTPRGNVGGDGLLKLCFLNLICLNVSAYVF